MSFHIWKNICDTNVFLFALSKQIFSVSSTFFPRFFLLSSFLFSSLLPSFFLLSPSCLPSLFLLPPLFLLSSFLLSFLHFIFFFFFFLSLFEYFYKCDFRADSPARALTELIWWQVPMQGFGIVSSQVPSNPNHPIIPSLC